MTPAAKTRLRFAVIVCLCFGVAVAIALYALKDSVTFFYSPSDLHRIAQENPARITAQKNFRLGGLVKEGSVSPQDAHMRITFIVTDLQEEQKVIYTGLLPDLFREKQGVVATGYLGTDDIFHAHTLLAKHDENYMPPEVRKALKKSGADGY